MGVHNSGPIPNTHRLHQDCYPAPGAGDNFEVQHLFKKAREVRGVIFPKYEPVASHGDPKSARNPEI